MDDKWQLLTGLSGSVGVVFLNRGVEAHVSRGCRELNLLQLFLSGLIKLQDD